MRRRDFLKAGVVVGGAAALPSIKLHAKFTGDTGQRPPLSKRRFTSEAVEKTILKAEKVIQDKDLLKLFSNCYPNTLDTTVYFSEKNGAPDTFIITGDIDAMWLRDSTAQVWPYLRLVPQDKKLSRMIEGVVNRQTACVLIDPFANAFNREASGSHWESDLTKMSPWLHERKWEVDSLCYTIRLAYGYWKIAGNRKCFNEKWLKAMKLILETFRTMQKDKRTSPYSFMRKTHVATDTLPLYGMGNPTKPCGLINSYFRPSDDATIYSYLIPSNLFASVSLKQLAEMSEAIFKNIAFAEECRKTAAEVDKAIEKYAIKEHEEFGKVVAFEVDGYGNRLFMDDANIPSLLSLPYLGVDNLPADILANTRRFVLSEKNPYYFKGKAGEGIGSPHTGIDRVWPLAIVMRGMTSKDDKEIKECIELLKNTHGGKEFMHESFHKDNHFKFTRKWFAWANTLFGEFILNTMESKPHLLK